MLISMDMLWIIEGYLCTYHGRAVAVVPESAFFLTPPGVLCLLLLYLLDEVAPNHSRCRRPPLAGHPS